MEKADLECHPVNSEGMGGIPSLNPNHRMKKTTRLFPRSVISKAGKRGAQSVYTS
jgi:hypothetical protein